MKEPISRRKFVNGCLSAGVGLTATSCSWRYRSTFRSPALNEQKEGVLALESDLSLNTATLVNLKSGYQVILVKTKDKLKGYKSICPHTACELNDGERDQPLDVKKNEIRCFLHDSYFDIETGKRIRGPAKPGSSLPLFPVKLREGKVYRG